jgi:group I intron endonuclease
MPQIAGRVSTFPQLCAIPCEMLWIVGVPLMNDTLLNKWKDWHPLSDWETLPLISGVYEIRNHSTGQSYIGSSVSLRNPGHYKLLTAGRSHNQRLQKSFNKHGASCFLFRILDFCPNQDPVPFEQSRIDERDFNSLYNVAPVAGSTLGYVFTDQQIQEFRKIRKGTPVPYEVRKSNWLKKVEREYKADRYKKLYREFRKTNEYSIICQEIERYLEQRPNKEQRFDIWWRRYGGREYIDARYQLSSYQWMHAEVGLGRVDGIQKTSLIKRIAERIINEKLAPQVDDDFTHAALVGDVGLQYSPLDPTSFGNSLNVEKYYDGSVESVTRRLEGIVMSQEWYPSGSPRLSLLHDLTANTIEKKVWHDNGKKQFLIQYANSMLHGVLCKWNMDDALVFAAHYDSGKQKKDLSHHDLEMLPEFVELFPRPSNDVEAGIFWGGRKNHPCWSL